MQPSDVCRICGGTGLLLQISDQGTNYTEDIEDCLSVKVKADDGHSQVLCHKCLGTLCLCKSFVTTINHIKDNNAAPSSKKCYTCQTTKGHLFPFPDNSVDKLQEYFGLAVVKTKNSKICHECQYFLDCVSDLREKANTANKLSRRGQDLQFMVKQKNATVEDLVCSLKNREVEVDESPQPRKASRTVKSSQIKSKGNGSTNNNVEEGLSCKRRSGAKNTKSATAEDDDSEIEVVDTRKKSKRKSVKENNLSDNDSNASSGRASGLKRRRQLGRSSDSDLNSSVDSVPESLSESRRSSRDDSNDSSKKYIKSKNSKEKAKPRLSPRSKRQKLSKPKEEAEMGSDSDSDSKCLASLANTDTDVKDEQLEESPKRSVRNSNAKSPVVNIVDINTPQKKAQGKPNKNAEAVKQKQSSRNSKNESESSRLSKRVHFEPESPKENKRKRQAEQSRKKMAKNSEESSDDDVLVAEARRGKNPPLNAYTCTICSDDFRSTVEGKEHELKHDERFNNFEIKLVRVLKPEIVAGTVKSLKETSKNEDDEEDDFWSVRSASTQKKTNMAGEEDAFNALFGDETDSKSPTTKGSNSRDLADESGFAAHNNSSDSEFEDPNKDTSKSEKPNDSSKTMKTENSKPSEVEKPEEVTDSKPSGDEKCAGKGDSSEMEEKNEVSGKEKLESEKEEKLQYEKKGKLASEKKGKLPPEKKGKLPPEKKGKLPPEKKGKLASEKKGKLASEKKGKLASEKEGKLASEKDEKLEPEKDEILESEKDEKLESEKEEKLESEKEEKLESEKEEKLESEKEEKLESEKEEKLESEKEEKLESEKEEKLESEKDEKLESEKEEKLESEKGEILESEKEEKLESEKEEKSDADDTTVAEPMNGLSEEEGKGEEGDGSKEEDKADEKATAEHVPEGKTTELNGTSKDAESVESHDKKEVNASVDDESSPVPKKSECVELPQSDVVSGTTKETISEGAEKAE